MKIHMMDFRLIEYTPCNYETSLATSLIRIGCSFPLHINYLQGKYQCVDGNKRLSALHDLLQDGKLIEKRMMIPVMVVNNGDLRTTPQHNMRNHH